MKIILFLSKKTTTNTNKQTKQHTNIKGKVENGVDVHVGGSLVYGGDKVSTFISSFTSDFYNEADVVFFFVYFIFLSFFFFFSFFFSFSFLFFSFLFFFYSFFFHFFSFLFSFFLFIYFSFTINQSI